MRYLLAPALALLAMASPAGACPHVNAQQVAFGISTCAACAAPVQGFSAAYGDPGVAPVGLPVQTQTTTTMVVQQPYTQVQQSTTYAAPQQVVVQAPAPIVYSAPAVFAVPVFATPYAAPIYGGVYGSYGGVYGGGFNRGFHGNFGFVGGSIHHSGFSGGFTGHHR